MAVYGEMACIHATQNGIRIARLGNCGARKFIGIAQPRDGDPNERIVGVPVA